MGPQYIVMHIKRYFISWIGCKQEACIQAVDRWTYQAIWGRVSGEYLRMFLAEAMDMTCDAIHR